MAQCGDSVSDDLTVFTCLVSTCDPGYMINITTERVSQRSSSGPVLNHLIPTHSAYAHDVRARLECALMPSSPPIPNPENPTNPRNSLLG